MTVEHGVTLTLDNVMVNGTIFNDVDATSIIQIDDGTTLTLNNATSMAGPSMMVRPVAQAILRPWAASISPAQARSATPS